MTISRNTRDTVLAVIAVAAVILYAGIGALPFIAAVLVLAWLLLRHREKTGRSAELPRYATIEDITREFGEPDDVITINAARANEPAGVILIYKAQQLLLIEGSPVMMSAITSVSVKNAATPYTIGQQQLILTTTIPHHESMRIDAGMDADMAREMAAQLITGMRQDS